MENVVGDSAFWAGRRVFITGHTGFKGSWLSLWLSALGARVFGYALPPSTSPSLFASARLSERLDGSTLSDVRDLLSLREAMRCAEPEAVFHLAAQPLVRASYRDPVGTYSTNVMGTVHVLEAARYAPSVLAIVNVTTDKVYRPTGLQRGHAETDSLGGRDPYSSSKACSELVTSAYRDSFFSGESGAPHGAAIATARSGNVIGGGDWAEDRLIPDCIRAFARGERVHVRNPEATRPWQHVLEPVAAYIALARRLLENGGEYSGAWNFGPSADDARTVRWIVEQAAATWGEGAAYEIEDCAGPYETKLLALDNTRATSLLGWRLRWAAPEAVQKTIQWYRAFVHGEDAARLCLLQLQQYEESR